MEPAIGAPPSRNVGTSRYVRPTKSRYPSLAIGSGSRSSRSQRLTLNGRTRDRWGVTPKCRLYPSRSCWKTINRSTRRRSHLFNVATNCCIGAPRFYPERCRSQTRRKRRRTLSATGTQSRRRRRTSVLTITTSASSELLESHATPTRRSRWRKSRARDGDARYRSRVQRSSSSDLPIVRIRVLVTGSVVGGACGYVAAQRAPGQSDTTHRHSGSRMVRGRSMDALISGAVIGAASVPTRTVHRIHSRFEDPARIAGANLKHCDRVVTVRRGAVRICGAFGVDRARRKAQRLAGLTHGRAE